jgi:hypothetical protein
VNCFHGPDVLEPCHGFLINPSLERIATGGAGSIR